MERVLEGRQILVGEFRNGRLVFKDAIDPVSGEKIQSVQYVYAVECKAAFGTVLIYRPHPIPGADAAVVGLELEKGRQYAFELERFGRKGGFVTAQLGPREPEPLG